MGILNWLTGGKLEAIERLRLIEGQRQKIEQLRSIIADNHAVIKRKSDLIAEANGKIVEDLRTIAALAHSCKVLEDGHTSIVDAETPSANGTVRKICRLSSDALCESRKIGRYTTEPMRVKS